MKGDKGEEKKVYIGQGQTGTYMNKFYLIHPLYPSPFETLSKGVEKELDSKSKIGDMTVRAEMTMPKSPIMGESAEKRFSPQLEKESLVSGMTKDISIEKEGEKRKISPFREFNNTVRNRI